MLGPVPNTGAEFAKGKWNNGEWVAEDDLNSEERPRKAQRGKRQCDQKGYATNTFPLRPDGTSMTMDVAVERGKVLDAKLMAEMDECD